MGMKKWITLLLLASMLLSVTAVAGASSPSISNSALTTVSGAGSVVDDPLVQAVVSAIGQHSGSAASYFGTSIASAIARLLPSGVSADSLNVTEAVAVDVSGYTAADLRNGITLSTPTYFADGAVVIVVIGIPDANGGVNWIPVKATVSGGAIQLKVSSSTAAKMTGVVTFVILSA